MTPKQLSPQQMQDAVDNFNRTYKIGDKVLVYRGSRKDPASEATIAAPGAYIMGGHTAVVQTVNGGCIAISHVKARA